MNVRSPDLVVRILVFGGWGCGAVSLLNPQKPPFSVFALVGGVLLVAAGIALASDGGRAMTRLNDRYAPWQRTPSYRWMGAVTILIGLMWAALGSAATIG